MPIQVLNSFHVRTIIHFPTKVKEECGMKTAEEKQAQTTGLFSQSGCVVEGVVWSLGGH